MNKDSANKTLSIINALENDLGISNQFFCKLIHEDDWSFIIKLHSLFEAAVTQLLTKELRRDELENIISDLELSNKKSGKLAFARTLNLLKTEESRYINSLSELRNQLVHKITNINFNLEQYVNSLNKQQLQSFEKAFAYSAKEEIDLNNRKIPRHQFIKENPKITIWMGAMTCLETIYQAKTSAELLAEFSSKLVNLAVLYIQKEGGLS